MRRFWPLALVPLLACMTPASRAAGTIISPADVAPEQWSESEKASNLVVRNLRSSPEASFHVLRVRTEISFRKHQKSDLVLMVVAGKTELRLGDRSIPSAPGDVVEVPRGIAYGVVNRGDTPAIVYAVYTPAFDPDDVKTIAEPSGEGAWKFNLWTQ
jgi:mannose-6-phosphate isomerase-like protein (cupin superfamily)